MGTRINMDRVPEKEPLKEDEFKDAHSNSSNFVVFSKGSVVHAHRKDRTPDV